MSDSDHQFAVVPRTTGVTPIPRVAELWRYPVKSLLGERHPALRLIADGIEGDCLLG